jgi:hypothetical protein
MLGRIMYDSVKHRYATVLTALFIGSPWITFASQSPKDGVQQTAPVELAVQRLAWELDVRKSVEVRAHTEIIQHKPDPQQPQVFDAVDDHYIETAIGQRRCDTRYLKAGAAASHYEYFSDGPRAADVIFSEADVERQASAVIKRRYRMEDRSDRMQRPEPLQFLYVGREPLHKALPRASYVGEYQALERRCDAFLFTQVRWEVTQDLVYYLDKATSIPLKVESFRNETDRCDNRALWVWTAESFDNVDGHPVTLNCKMIAFSGESTPAFTWNIHVRSITFDKDFPAAVFWPALQPGVKVLDTISGKSFEVPGPTIPLPARATTVQPIEALPPRSWTSTISSVTLVAGAAIFILASVLWWRRR